MAKRHLLDLTAQQLQAAIVASTSLDKGCASSIAFDEAKFTSSIQKHGTGILSAYAGAGSPEGKGSVREFLGGAISVAAGEAYMTLEEFRTSKKADGAHQMVLGLRLTIDRNSCDSEELQGTLEIFRNKDNNVVSKTEFKIK